ncbi:hypothetical protein U9M48_022788 [Paspalum notatum var. saurae]|uniref:Leucine-rich repeat-containing N-terminal plant-type domain-containing protein n=1 Tax=Paspalum notatum var. saurae TaxID=547442 RepID=A0AAQ3TNV7_PASNO
MCHSKKLVKLAVHMPILLPLVLLYYGAASTHCSTVHENNRDLQALLDFKQGITSDPNGALSNWAMSSHFCQWNGVKCTPTPPLHVTYLLLDGQKLSSQISSSLGNLTFLKYLDLSSNNFVGPVPLLDSLQQLLILYLNNNNLSENIPDALTSCSNLTALDLSSNSLVGSIPPKLGLLSNLVYLNLRSNQLNGSIPGELGQLKLQTLILSNNRLSGEIPQAFYRLSSLNYLGPIPASLGNNALGLQVIDLSFNNFTGQIPTSLGKLSNLTFLNLEYNWLVARNNQDWEFLNALRNCTSLQTLSLSYNELHGSLPPSIGNLSASLQTLLLGGNSLSGQVPQSIGKLRGLTWLALDENNFSGTIEGWIEKLKSLKKLHLESNKFSGHILS